MIIAEFDEASGLERCLSALNGGEQLFGFTVTAEHDQSRRAPQRDRGGYGGGRGGYGGDRGGYGGERGG